METDCETHVSVYSSTQNINLGIGREIFLVQSSFNGLIKE